MEEPLDLSCKGNTDVPDKSATDVQASENSRVKTENIKKYQKACKNLLPCEVCRKNFDRPSLLKRHLRTHTGEKPHVCEICNKGFSTSSSLNTHRRIHTGLKPHICGHCGKRFTASSNLYYHRMTHTKIKPHKCTMCTKSFPTPGDLKSHMYIHSGCWPYRCSICSRGFSKQTNLKNHFMLHTGDKPHSCKYCQKRFALPCNLKAHLKLHHPTEEAKFDATPPPATENEKHQVYTEQNFSFNNFIPEMYRNFIYEEFHKNMMSFGLPYVFPTFEHNLTFHLSQNLPK